MKNMSDPATNGYVSEKLWRAASPDLLPPDAVWPIVRAQLLDRQVIASLTGPDIGFQAAREWKNSRVSDDNHTPQHGQLQNSKYLFYGNHVIVDKWKEIENDCAFGKSISLYDTNPITGRTSGDPNADAYVLKMRKNCAFLAVADGVNWGEAPMRAARCAINAVYEHVEANLFLGGPESLKIFTTKDACKLLFEAFHRAHLDIVAETDGLSTLCAGLLLPVHRKRRKCVPPGTVTTNGSESPDEIFALVLASVGDSQAFILRESSGAVEITGWVPKHDLNGTHTSNNCTAELQPPRDFRDTGGALGSVSSSGEPELNNLICAVAICGSRDMILFGTDGLTDNFDPVVAKFAIPQSPTLAFVDDDQLTSFVGTIDSGDKSTTADCGGLRLNLLSLDASDSDKTTDKRSNYLFSELSSVHRPVKHKWTNMSPIANPPLFSVWPKPPPPPTDDNVKQSSNSIAPVGPRNVGEIDECADEVLNVSARSFNFTDQLELSWPERRQYTTKELTRIWHELDSRMSSSDQNHSCFVTAVDFGKALLNHVSNVTEQKRDLLQAPETIKLKSHFTRYMRKKCSHKLKTSQQQNDSFMSAKAPPQTDDDDDVLTDLEARRALIMDALRSLPGKLDHATVLTLEVGSFSKKACS